MAELDQVVDAEVVVQLGEVDAKRLDTNIRLTAGTVSDNFAKLQDYVHQAKTGEIHLTLGFASWPAYLADALGEQPLLLERAERRELVEFLSTEGMSTRAIAAVAGVSRETVRQEIAAGDKKLSPATPSAKLKQRREHFDDEVEHRTGATVVGLDGKAYKKKAPSRIVVDPASTTDQVATNDEVNADDVWPRSTYPIYAIDLIQQELDKNPRRKGPRYTVYRSVKNVHVTVDVTDQLILHDDPDTLLSVSAQEAKEYRALLAEAIGQLRKLDRQLALRESVDAGVSHA